MEYSVPYNREDSSYIDPTALIYPGVTLGKNIYIGAYSVIGSPPEHRDYWNKNYKSVIIKDGARITNHVTVDAGTINDTVIGRNCILLAKSHVGHDAIIEDNVTISVGAIVGGHTVVKEYANIALNATIHQNTLINSGCMVGMGAVVTKKLVTEPFKTYVGNPAHLLGENSKHPFYTIYQKETL